MSQRNWKKVQEFADLSLKQHAEVIDRINSDGSLTMFQKETLALLDQQTRHLGIIAYTLSLRELDE